MSNGRRNGKSIPVAYLKRLVRNYTTFDHIFQWLIVNY